MPETVTTWTTHDRAAQLVQHLLAQRVPCTITKVGTHYQVTRLQPETEQPTKKRRQ
jgi:hypothetical protein